MYERRCFTTFNPIAIEVKNEILEKIKKGEKVTTLANQYGISDKTIYTWLGRKAIGTVSLLEHNRLRSENQQLKQIIGVLTLELEKTKKRSEIQSLVEKAIKKINKSLLVKLIGIARSGIYQTRNNPTAQNEILKEQILKVLEVNPSYGHRRIALALCCLI